MQIFLNPETKACSIIPENIERDSTSGTSLLTLEVSEDVFRLLTEGLKLPDYYNMIDKLIRGVNISDILSSNDGDEVMC